MKVGIFSPYFETFGGGERYILTVAEFFLKRGDKVDIFWNGDKDTAKIKDRFDIDLSKANFVRDIFHNHTNLFQKLAITASYDLIFFLSDGSLPLSLAKKNILHFQQPFHYQGQSLLNKIKLLRISAVICNSAFTKKYIDETYDTKSMILYPPVDVAKFSSGKKENIILSVGRFFGPSHPKKQEVLIEAFKKMSFSLKDWRLVLIGGITENSESMLAPLRQKAAGYPITLIPDSSFKILRDYYSRAKIYWHATGFGEDLEKFPGRAEHFGITTVEAMSAGCIPIVFAGGGQKEIVTEGKNGFFWQTVDQLIKKTIKVANDKKLQEEISKNAIARSDFFSKERFFKELNAII